MPKNKLAKYRRIISTRLGVMALFRNLPIAHFQQAVNPPLDITTFCPSVNKPQACPRTNCRSFVALSQLVWDLWHSFAFFRLLGRPQLYQMYNWLKRP